MYRLLKVTAFVVGVAAAGSASALEPITPWVSLASVHTDNAERASVNGTETTTADAIVGIRVRQDGRFNAHLDASYLYREFLQGDFPSQKIPAANGVVSYSVIPERFALTAEESLGQISSRPFDALASTDRQDVNYFTVGPDINVPFGSRFRFDLTGRYGQANFKESNIDSTRYTGEVALTRMLGDYSSLSVHQYYEEIEYDLSNLFPRSQMQSTYARLTGENSRTLMMLELGQASIKVGDGETDHSPRATLLLQRRLSSRATLAFEYTHGSSDSADTLRSNVRDGFNPTGDQNVIATADPFTRDQGYLMLLRTGPRSDIAAQVTWNQEKYQTSAALDRREYGADLLFDRRLSAMWTLAATFRYENEKTDLSGDVRKRYAGSVGLTRRLTRSLQVAAVVEHSHGAGDVPLDRFRENSFTLMLHYSPRELAAEVFDPVSEFRSYERPWRSRQEQRLNNENAVTPGAPVPGATPTLPR
jgi:hypothetical protein